MLVIWVISSAIFSWQWIVSLCTERTKINVLLEWVNNCSIISKNRLKIPMFLYFFFGHWIVCTLFCTFSLVIGLSVLYFVLFLLSLDCLYFILYFFFGHWIVCTLFCTFSLGIGLFVLYVVHFLWSLDCLYFILYFFFGYWIVCTLFCTFSLIIGLFVLYLVLFL
jgi:hypothetical protein